MPADTKNAPDAGQGVEGIEGTNPLGKEPVPMSVDICDENDTPDAHDFVQYMHEFNPAIKPGTAMWSLFVKEHESEATAVVPRNGIVESLFPDAEPPSWAQLDETNNYKIPSYCTWRSIPARVNTTKMTGHLNEDMNTFASAYLSLRITQSLHASEPAIKVTRVGKYVGADHLDDVDDYLLSLEEATELAHTLLLLLDVVNETAGA